RRRGDLPGARRPAARARGGAGRGAAAGRGAPGAASASAGRGGGCLARRLGAGDRPGAGRGHDRGRAAARRLGPPEQGARGDGRRHAGGRDPARRGGTRARHGRGGVGGRRRRGPRGGGRRPAARPGAGAHPGAGGARAGRAALPLGGLGRGRRGSVAGRGGGCVSSDARGCRGGGAMRPTQRRVLSSVTLVLLTALWGRSAGAQTTERVSVASDGTTEGNDASLGSALSADGRFVAFDSAATDLVAGDTNGVSDVLVHDRQTGTTERVSVASDGTESNAASLGSGLSADGRLVAFQSAATNLVAGDTNGTTDVFVHDRQTDMTARVSVASDGTQANDDSSYPALSADGRLVAFQSAA